MLYSRRVLHHSEQGSLCSSGQIELYTHLPVMRQLVERLQQWEFRVCGVFLVDSQFMVESFKVRVHLSLSPGREQSVTSPVAAVHLWSHGSPELHGVARDPSS